MTPGHDHSECCGPWGLDSANLYISCRRRLVPDWDAPRVPYIPLRFNGPICDRIGCGEHVRSSDFYCARFCTTHQTEHTDRLLAQIEAMYAELQRKQDAHRAAPGGAS